MHFILIFVSVKFYSKASEYVLYCDKLLCAFLIPKAFSNNINAWFLLSLSVNYSLYPSLMFSLIFVQEKKESPSTCIIFCLSLTFLTKVIGQ